MATRPPDVLALGDLVAALCRAAGLHTDTEAPTPERLAEVDAVVLDPSSLDRLRTWRIAGHGLAAILLGVAPDDAEALQPAHFIAPDALLATAQRVAQDRSLQRLRLPHGLIDLRRRRFEPDQGEAVGLSQREADLLAYLARHQEREVRRDEVQTEVFGHAKAASNTRAVDMAVSRLRKKIEPDPKQPTVLLTARGGGYRFVLASADDDDLVGRSTLMAQVVSALDGGALVTLKGPPGVGKTRLAQGICDRQGGRFVRLDAVNDPGQVAVAIAAQLDLDVGAEPEEVDGVERLIDTLDGVELLVLDNAEQIVEAVANVVWAIRRQQPELDVLVTSQHALDIDDEQVLEVPPLDTDAATRLFLARADEAPPPELLRAVVESLDGLPLAIELASTWGRSVPWDHVASLLATRDASLVARLRASWALLDHPSRHALGLLAAFAGPFDFHDIEGVLDDPDALRTLVSASLVQRLDDSYRVLAPVRDFVRSIGPQQEARDRHHAHWVRQAKGLVDQLSTAEGPTARRVLAERFADLDRAWSTRTDPWLALALESVHRAHGQPDVRRALIETAWAAHPEPEARTRLGMVRLTLHPAQRMFELAAELEEATDHCKDPALKARALAELAWVRYRGSKDITAAHKAKAYAQTHGQQAEERLADYLVSSQQVRGDVAALRKALPVWESITQDLEAYGAFRHALRAAGSVASTWASLGETRRAHLALLTLGRILRTYPDAYYEGLFHNLQAYEHLDAGDFDGALASFESMRRARFGMRGSPDAIWMKNRALVLLDCGRTAEAERELETALVRMAELPTFQLTTGALLAVAQLDDGRVDEALATLNTYTPNDQVTGVSRAYYCETLAIALALAGREDEARAVHDGLDPDALGHDAAAVFWGVRGMLGSADALGRLVDLDTHTVTLRSVAKVAAAFGDAEALAAYETFQPHETPVLPRLLAKVARQV